MAVLYQIKGFAVFMELIIKSSLILAAALVGCLFLRKRSASLRHLVLRLAMMVLLILPLVHVFAPGWQTNLIPTLTQVAPANQTARQPGAGSDTGSALASAGAAQAASAAEKEPGAPLLLFLQDIYPYALPVLWCLGISLLLARLFLGLYGTFNLTRHATSLDGYPWQQLFLLFSRKTPLNKKIRLLKNRGVIVPLTWGVRRPVILLPGESSGWPVKQCSAALFHELAHIKRGDFLARLLARLACCLYWFNPLGWIVLRKLKREQEKACDEMVLKAGIKPSTYASCLLHMRQSLQRARWVPNAALGMAGHTEFKERVTSILKKQINIKETKMKTKLTLIAAAILALALIGTARPYQAPLPADEEAATVETPAAKAEPQEAAAKAEEKEKKEKKCAESAKAEVHVRISMDEDEEDTGKKCKKVRKIVVNAGDVKKACKVKLDGDFLIVYEGDKVVKKIDLKKEGKDLEWISKSGEVIKIKGDKIHVCSGDDEDADVYIVKVGEEGKSKDIYIKKRKDGDKVYKKAVKIKGIHMDDIAHNVKFIGEHDEKLHKELEEKMAAMEKALESIDKEFKTKSPAQQKAIQEMEEALKKMEKELQKREQEHKEIAIHLAKDASDHELIELDHGKKFTIKKHKDKDFIFITKDRLEHAEGMHMKYIVKAKIDKKQVDQIKKAVKKLQKSLPKAYKVTPEFDDDSIKISIDCPDEEQDKKSEHKAQEAIEGFEAELKDILPGKSGEKGLMKMISIKEKEEKKEEKK